MTCGSLEIEIMNAVWGMLSENDDREISVKDVTAFLAENGIERAYTTVKTVMDRLSVKGTLARYRNGKKFFYSATTTKSELASQAVGLVVKRFFNGSKIDFLRFVEKECESLLV